jgi:hypothetical protein
MAADDFFSRWSKKKGDTPDTRDSSGTAAAVPENTVTAPQADEPAGSLPTLDDVTRLTQDSDFSSFMAQGVDENVKRAAMKKLFSDPHFNVMDGLDVYIEDYNTFEPLTPEILASLNHAKALLDPLARYRAPVVMPASAEDEVTADSNATIPDMPPESAANEMRKDEQQDSVVQDRQDGQGEHDVRAPETD